MKTYRIYELDVWGNADDGYDVNDVFKTSFTVTMNDNFTDDELKEALKNIYFAPSVANEDIEISDIGDDTVIYLDYKGKPQIEIRLEA